MSQFWASSGLLHNLVTAEGRHELTSSGCWQEVLLARPLPSCWPLLGDRYSPVHQKSSPVLQKTSPVLQRSSRVHLSLVACRVSRAVLDGRHVALLEGWA